MTGENPDPQAVFPGIATAGEEIGSERERGLLAGILKGWVGEDTFGESFRMQQITHPDALRPIFVSTTSVPHVRTRFIILANLAYNKDPEKVKKTPVLIYDLETSTDEKERPQVVTLIVTQIDGTRFQVMDLEDIAQASNSPISEVDLEDSLDEASRDELLQLLRDPLDEEE